ncbi:tripartite tricarboxylate transporter substrate binding protein [Siminovitchia sp. 179-K 8D1 HS]|uniref:tripartite tricarboxylate transporter substrate binding protein n=1 Tax=Siminovitchia sp. 179-K 8D1 HS TaxID=3142385 RepID=UPI0039A072EE
MINKKSLFILVVLFTLLIVTACGGKASDTNAAKKGSDADSSNQYPNRQIEIIVPFAAGGGTDAVARVLAESLKPILNQEIVVVNREGGSGANGMNEGLNANPDGYTLTLVTREVAALPLQGIAPFETMDFKFVANVNEDPGVLVVPANSSYNNVQDLVEEVKANPGKMKFAASVVPNYYGIQFSEGTEVEFTTVPYQGAAPAITEILGGGADFGIYTPGEIKQFIDSGDLRPLAVMATERYQGLDDVPTFQEEGFNIVSGTYRGIAVPKDTPGEVVQVLSEAIKEAVETEKFKEFMNESFLGIGYYDSKEFEELIKNDIGILKPIIEIAKKEEN